MIRKRVACPFCSKRGVKEYKATDYSEREKGKPYPTKKKRVCLVCKGSWFN